MNFSYIQSLNGPKENYFGIRYDDERINRLVKRIMKV